MGHAGKLRGWLLSAASLVCGVGTFLKGARVSSIRRSLFLALAIFRFDLTVFGMAYLPSRSRRLRRWDGENLIRAFNAFTCI